MVYVPPPMKMKRRLKCISCGLLTAENGATCEHCGGFIPSEYREQQKENARKRERRVWIIGVVLLVAITLLFVWLFPNG